MKLNARDLKTIRMALLIAADAEASLADAYRTKLHMRRGHVVNVVTAENKPIVRAAKARVARFLRLADRLTHNANSASKKRYKNAVAL